MRCTQCGTTNEASLRFCIECGARLGASCPACGRQNLPAAKFCGECGTALAAAAGTSGPARLEQSPGADTTRAERRLVSVLFADLVGFTPFSEGRDAEEVRETLTRYFDLAREVIERYGGTVEKFIGDAVMAVWGAPVAHEDGAERAVRAAVDLVDAVQGMDAGLQARAGVLTGEAAVTLGATGQGMVAGDLVNTASRVQSVAEPGSVLVDEATMRSAAVAIAFETAGERELKGKASPVQLWRALRVVAERGGRGRSDGLEAPFVGRDIEFRLLKELFHASSRDRRVRMVSISGQGGIGKSRLAWELEKYLDGLVETVWFHHGRSPSYGSGLAFWALGEMVRGRCGLAEGDDEATTRTRVAETVARFVPEPADQAWIGEALLTLLGVGDSATPSDQLFPAWRSFFEHIARQGSTLLVFEDVQFADPGLLAFIEHVMSWSRDLPLFMVTLTRPELLARHPEWGTSLGASAITLLPLGEESMHELLTGLVPGLPKAARDRIVARADGYPLYAIETVRMLVNDGRLVLEDGAYRPTGDLSRLEVPETLRALVASRLDALEPEDRALLQSGAVIGQTFSVDALRAVTGEPVESLEPRLLTLVRREMLTLRADPRSPERGQYAFAQELVREVAYETLSRDDRRSRHLATARYFESLEAEELAGALAVQYQAAHRNARPGPEAEALAVQARLTLRVAAQRALSLGSTEQAQQLFEAALELTDDPLDQAALLASAARAASMAGHPADGRRHAQRAIDIYREAGDRSAAARISATLVEAVVNDGWQLEAARIVARKAAEEYGDLGDDEGLAQTLSQLARLEMLVQEDLGAAVAIADRALATAERLDLPALVADLLVTKGSALCTQGRNLEGLGVIEAGRRLAEEEGLARVESRALLNMTAPLGDRDPHAQTEATRKSVELARRVGSLDLIGVALANMTEGAREVGRLELAMSMLRPEADAANEQTRYRVRMALAQAMADCGEDTTAMVPSLVAYCEERIASGERSFEIDLLVITGYLALLDGRYSEAVRDLSAVATSDPMNAPPLFGLVGLAALLQRDRDRTATAIAGLDVSGAHGTMLKLRKRQLSAGIAALDGKTEQALAGFTSVLSEYRRLDLPFAIGQTTLLMCALLDPALPEAQAAEQEAREVFTRTGMRAWLKLLDHAVESRQPTSSTAPALSGDVVTS